MPSLKLSSIKEFVSVISFYILTRLFVSGLIGGGDEWRKKNQDREKNERGFQSEKTLLWITRRLKMSTFLLSQSTND